jgi:putative endonuclease
MYTVYVLWSLKDGKRYIGLTKDLECRFMEHNAGEVTSTRYRRPFAIEYQEIFEIRGEAREREKYFKTASGRRSLDRYVDNKVRREDRATRPND